MYHDVMRTTVDLDKALIEKARARAAKTDATLSQVLEEALRAYLELSQQVKKEKFELLTAGCVGGRYPRPDEVAELLTQEEHS